MDDFENKLGAILGDPKMMEQIMSLAGQLESPKPPQDAPGGKPCPPPEPLPQMPDPALLKSISGIAKQGNIDKNQQSLLRALRPYLSKQRIGKLEKAMRAAKLATVAGQFLNRSERAQAGDGHV